MAKKKTKESCCNQAIPGLGGCKVEAMITVDERGQMVLPKDLRDKIGVKPGDKLALVSMEKDGKICCISLIKAEEFSEMVKNILEPVMKDLF
jgi:antitoxin PrlF